MNQERKQQIDDALATFFFGCNIPFVTVESEYFINFVNQLNNAYHPPTRKTLAESKLDKCYNALIQSYKTEEVEDGILLMDGWKNSNANKKNVVAITYTTNEKYIFLESFNFSEVRETGDNLSEVIDRCIELALERYNIRLYALITDNASNMLAAARQADLWNVTCNSHSGNLLFKYLVNRDLNNRVTAAVKDFKSPDLEAKLIAKGGHKMVLSGDTRWCSVRDKYQRCFQNLELMREIINEDRLIQNPVERHAWKNGVIETILDPNLDDELTRALILYNPICELVNTCQKSHCSIANACELWLHLELPEENAGFELVLGQRLEKVINKYNLAANFLCPSLNGRRF